MFEINQYVQIMNHSEPQCNGQYGTVQDIVTAYDGTYYYTVALEDTMGVCVCTDDELMEG